MRLISLVFALLAAAGITGCAVAQPGLAMTPPLRIDEVVAMSTRGESDAVIIAQIQQRGTAFVLTPQDLAQQRAVGISDSVLRYVQGRSDGDQALRARILSGQYPVPIYYGSSYLGYSYLGYHAGQHYYGGTLHGYSGGHALRHHGGHHGGEHH
ncbi:hypothetical protein D9M73_91280 [compost metagenome]